MNGASVAVTYIFPWKMRSNSKKTMSQRLSLTTTSVASLQQVNAYVRRRVPSVRVRRLSKLSKNYDHLCTTISQQRHVRY